MIISRHMRWLTLALVLSDSQSQRGPLLEEYKHLLIPHIGKTGGSSMTSIIEKHCETWKDTLKCQKCYPPMDTRIPYQCTPEPDDVIIYGHGK